MSTQLSIYTGVSVEQQALMAAFSKENGMQSFIDQITEQAKSQAVGLDPCTAKGRKEIASIAYSVAKAKTALDNQGKELVSDAKAKIKIVDNERKTMRDALDSLRDEIRLPVTKFEEAEEARKTEADGIISKCLVCKNSVNEFGQPLTSEQVGMRLAEISALEVADNEFTDTVAKYKAETELFLTNLGKSVKEQEEQEAELARLRAEAEAKRVEEERQRREAEIAAKAKEEAEREAQAKIEQARREAEQAKLRAEEEAQRKVDAERERIAREQSQKEAEAKQQAEQEVARQANTENRRRINATAMQSFVDAGFDEDTAKQIISLIVIQNCK